MTLPRLAHALETGALELPKDARLVFLEPTDEFDVSDFDVGDIEVQQNDKPSFDRFEQIGARVAVHVDGPADFVHVSLPRSRDLARGLIAQANDIAKGGVVLVDGAKTDGIDATLKAVKARTDIVGQLSKAHGKLFWFTASDAFADWTLAAPAPVKEGWITQPGVFSADGPDAGSKALVDALPASLKGDGADLGGGWGFLTKFLLALPKVAHVDLVEADHRALSCAKCNLDDPRVSFHWADATVWGAAASLDWVVSNPPFHTSRTPDASIGQAFITSAARLLKPKGQLIIVANRHLPYETTLADSFVQVQELDGDTRFKILHAEQPKSRDRAMRRKRR
ncbi:class I SAM-dependent methyltransferase [Marivita sp. S0852]|uniref:class I SAM-dependent methyltransferase n=1 Tax=Marivita sp. S0852 TaxID=3373893 RepID=UPI0039824505